MIAAGTCAWCHDRLTDLDWQIVCPACGKESMVTIVRAPIAEVWRDEAWLREHLIERGLTTRQAAQAGTTSPMTISRWARRWGIEK